MRPRCKNCQIRPGTITDAAGRVVCWWCWTSAPPAAAEPAAPPAPAAPAAPPARHGWIVIHLDAAGRISGAGASATRHTGRRTVSILIGDAHGSDADADVAWDALAAGADLEWLREMLPVADHAARTRRRT